MKTEQESLLKRERQTHFKYVSLYSYQKDNHQLSYYSSNVFRRLNIETQRRGPCKGNLFFEKQKEMTHICIPLEMVGYGNTKKIGPFKLPTVILLHFRVSQYKCKTCYCKKKSEIWRSSLALASPMLAFLQACLDLLPVTPICPSWRTELLFRLWGDLS